MLDKKSKRILAILNENKPDYPDNPDLGVLSQTSFTFDYIQELSGYEFIDLIACLKFLNEQGYVEYAQQRGLDYSPGVYLTHEGRHYRIFRRIHLVEFLTNSILVPMVVALLTSVVTTWIGWMWSQR